MSIESDAQKDLALTDEDAENVAGGKRAKKASTKAAAPTARTYPVGYINVQGPPPAAVTTDPTGGSDDCDPGFTSTDATATS